MVIISLIFSLLINLPSSSMVDLSIIPESRCGIWASNVGRVVTSKSPNKALEMWNIIYPTNANIIQLTYDYISQSDVMSSGNPAGVANTDCLSAPLRKTYGI